MAKFLQRLFGGRSFSKRSSLRGSQTSINDSSRRTGASSHPRSAASLDDLSSYHINPKELEKNKLHKASWEGNLQKVERLARPNQINQKDQHFRTPLHLAIVKGHLDIVRYLVHEGAKLDVVDSERRTPLVIAVLCRNQNVQVNYQICRILLEGGAHSFINAVDVHGNNALHYAIDSTNEYLVSLFLTVPECDPNFRDRDQMTPLHLAVKKNSHNIVQLLLSDELEHQADPNLMNRNGETPLHMAARNNSVEIVRTLLQSNLEEPIDPTFVDAQQLTAYQIAQASHHDICAKLIDEYQQGWTKFSPRRTSESINEQEINPIVMNQAQHFLDDQDETTENTSSEEASQLSRTSEQIKRSSNQWSDRTIPSARQETRSLADMIKNNPLQPDINKTNLSKSTNQTLANLMNNIPLQPDETTTNKSTISQQKQPSSIYGFGPAPLQHRETDNTSTNTSIDKALMGTNLIAEQPSSIKKNTTINSLVNALPHPESIASNSNLWTRDAISPHKQAKSIDTWDESSTTQSDDDDTGIYRAKPELSNFPKQQTSSLNGTAVFTTTSANYNVDDSNSDEDSIEAAIQKLNAPKSSDGVQGLVNKQIENNYMISQSKSIPNIHSPISEHSSWTASSATPNNESPTKGISALVNQLPLIAKKPSESTWDDSRPLSADLNRNTIKSKSQTFTSSDDSEEDSDNKSATIVKSPLTHGIVASLVQANMRPTDFTETKATGSLSSLVQSSMRPTNFNETKPTSSLPNLLQTSVRSTKIAETEPDSVIATLVQANMRPTNFNETKSLDNLSNSTQPNARSTDYGEARATGGLSSLVQSSMRPGNLTETKTTSSLSSLVQASMRPTDIAAIKPLDNLSNSIQTNAHLTDYGEVRTTGGLSSLVQSSMRPGNLTETKTTGSLSNLVQTSMRPKETADSDPECVVASLVQTNVQPTGFTETTRTSVENLTKNIHTTQYPLTNIQKQSASPSPKTSNRLLVSQMAKRSDSLSSDASSLIDDTVRTLTHRITPTIRSRQHLYNNDVDEQNWSPVRGDGHDSKFITRKYSNEMIQQSHRPSSHQSIHHDFNNLRGSMSSSTSSIQNNMERISELREDIKQIERKQEDSFELRRQLKDMEIKKNNFEALYKKHDQLLRDTETKLEKEITEKQHLEWATKNLNMELKNVKQKLQSLEDEKDTLNQRYIKLKEERDNYDEKLRIHQMNSLHSTTAGILREEDVEKIKFRHREEMKLLSAENDDLHHRTRQLQSDLQLHKESLDVTIRYKIDLEKALEDKTLLQHELDRLKYEKEFIEQEKTDYKIKYANLQEEIRVILLDRSKLEEKLTIELQEHIIQRQRSTDDSKKYKTQIEQLNIKLGDAEARLLVLQTQNEALLASKDREIKHGFDTLTQRLNMIEYEKINAEQRYRDEHKEIMYRQQQQQQQKNHSHEPLVIVTSTPVNNPVHSHQHSLSSPCTKCGTLQRSYEQERHQRLQTEKDNERLRDVVSRQKQQHELDKSFEQHRINEHIIAENSTQIRSETERVKQELNRLRNDFDKLVLNYEPSNNLQQQAELHSQIDTLRQFYEKEFRQKQLLLSQLNNGIKSVPVINVHHRTSSPIIHDEYDHSLNGSFNCSICSNSRLLRERLENAIDTSLADQRIQTIKQMPILPRQTSPLLTSNNLTMPSVDLLRKRYYV